MSVDIKIQNLCDHVVNWEQGTLQSDLKSILFSKPIASTASLSVRVNNVVLSPSTYSVEADDSILSADRPFYVVLHERTKLFQPLAEAQYTTIQTFCRKCLGTRYVDDYEYINDRDMRTTRDEELLLQNVEKYIITKIESNPFHSWIGTGLHTLIGSKILDNDLLTTRMTEQVNAAIDKLKTVQRQLQASGREVTQGELFGDLLSLEVFQQDDPSVYNIVVKFTSQSGKVLELEQPVDLQSTFRTRLSFS